MTYNPRFIGQITDVVLWRPRKQLDFLAVPRLYSLPSCGEFAESTCGEPVESIFPEMKEVYPPEFFVQKAYELSYALFRLADKARGMHPALADRLEENALDLLGHVVVDEFSGAQKTLSAVHYLLRVGGDAGALNPSHVHMIVAETDKLNSAIEYGKNSAKDENPADIFSDWKSEATSNGSLLPESENSYSRDSANEHESSEDMKREFGNDKNIKNNSDVERVMDLKGSLSIEERLWAIFGRIRQSGSCRMKEIQEALPDVSERTIRYDLQKLLERGSVERVGNGGPATFYRVRRVEPVSL